MQHEDPPAQPGPLGPVQPAQGRLTALPELRSCRRDPERHFGPCVREPAVELAAVRLEALDEAPKAPRVIQREQMTELVNQQVTDDGRVEEQRARIDADVALARAAAPARTLQTDLHAPRQTPDRFGLPPEPRLQVRARLVEQPLAQQPACVPVIGVFGLDEQRLARDLAARTPALHVTVTDAIPEAERAQRDARRQQLAVARIACLDVRPSPLDPVTVLLDERLHVPRTRADRHDQLERVRRDELKEQAAGPTALAHDEFAGGDERGRTLIV